MTQPIEFTRAIRAFMAAAGDNVGPRPDARTVARYTGMQYEELAEKMEAIGFVAMADILYEWGRKFKSGTHDAMVEHALEQPDRSAGMLDADVDLAWVSIAGSFAAGADVQGACAEVARANMSKVHADGTVHRDASGKITKPPWYIAPDLSALTHRSKPAN